jgi:hypothetical protein
LRRELRWVEQVGPSLREETAARRWVRLGGFLCLRCLAARAGFLRLGDDVAEFADFSDHTDVPDLGAIDDIHTIDDIDAVDDMAYRAAVDDLCDLADVDAVDDVEPVGDLATVDDVYDVAGLGAIDDVEAVGDFTSVALNADRAEVAYVNGVAEVADVSKFAVGPVVALVIDNIRDVADVDAFRCIANVARVDELTQFRGFSDLSAYAYVLCSFRHDDALLLEVVAAKAEAFHEEKHFFACASNCLRFNYREGKGFCHPE